MMVQPRVLDAVYRAERTISGQRLAARRIHHPFTTEESARTAKGARRRIPVTRAHPNG